MRRLLNIPILVIGLGFFAAGLTLFILSLGESESAPLGYVGEMPRGVTITLTQDGAEIEPSEVHTDLLMLTVTNATDEVRDVRLHIHGDSGEKVVEVDGIQPGETRETDVTMPAHDVYQLQWEAGMVHAEQVPAHVHQPPAEADESNHAD